jgi:hypothetical protein
VERGPSYASHVANLSLSTIIFKDVNEHTLMRNYTNVDNPSLILVPLRGMGGLIQESIPKYRMWEGPIITRNF